MTDTISGFMAAIGQAAPPAAPSAATAINPLPQPPDWERIPWDNDADWPQPPNLLREADSLPIPATAPESEPPTKEQDAEAAGPLAGADNAG